MKLIRPIFSILIKHYCISALGNTELQLPKEAAQFNIEGFSLGHTRPAKDQYKECMDKYPDFERFCSNLADDKIKC